MLSRAFRPALARRTMLAMPARQFAMEMSVGGQSLEVSQAGDGKVATMPLYFDNQATTPTDPR